MSGRGKRRWAPRTDFNGAYQETLDFLKDCQAHQLPLVDPGQGPQLYRAYLVDGAWPANDGQEISRVLRHSYGHRPAADRAKQAVARLLSVATKAHYFMAEAALVAQEPSVFTVPDLAQPGSWRHGLLYPLDVPSARGPSKQRTLVVAEWDLVLSAHREPRVARGDEFPVVLVPDPFAWLSIKKWRSLRALAGDQPWFEASDHPGRRKLLDAVKAHTDKATFPYGTLLDYPIQIKDDTAATGAMWAPGVKSWFLPHGFDVDAVKTYLDRLAGHTADEQRAHRWWERRKV